MRSATALLAPVQLNGEKVFLALEDGWYRVGDVEEGNRQFVVADPDGYLLRFYEDLGTRAVK